MIDRPYENIDGNELIEKRNYLLNVITASLRVSPLPYADKDKLGIEFEEIVRELTLREGV